jgi:hypothetical protein
MNARKHQFRTMRGFSRRENARTPMAKLNIGLSSGVLCANVCMTKPQADRIGREVPIG